jgi:HK97 gp10 family phage protein
MTAELNGAKALEGLLKQFPSRIQRDIINSVASRGAVMVKKHAKRNIKANGSIDTGALYNSIRTKKVRGEHGKYYIYSDRSAPHSHLVEFGTGPRKLQKPTPFEIAPGEWIMLETTGSMPAKPFFRPALDENQTEVLKEMRERAAKRMLKEAEKMAQSYGTMSKSFRRKLAK